MPTIKKTPSAKREEAITRALKIGLIDKGWTVAHLADLCGMHHGQTSRIINHPMKVRLETVLDIAAKLGISSIPTK